MKKIVTLIVSLVLIVSALFCSYIPTDYKAGKGSGENEEVKTIETLSEVIADTCRLMSTQSNSSAQQTSSLPEKNMATLLSAESTENSLSAGTIPSYESVTVTADISEEFSCAFGENYSEYDYSFVYNGQMTVHIDSDGEMLISMRNMEITMDFPSGSELGTRIYGNFDADIYINDGVCAAKYYSFSLNGTAYKDILGKWIDVNSIENEFSSFFDTFKNFLTNWLMNVNVYITNYRDEAFNQENEKFVMNDEYLRKFILDQFKIANNNFLGASYDYIKSDALSMEVDLSNRCSPTVTTDAKDVKYSTSVYMNADDSSPTEVVCQYSECLCLRFENINNTVIDFDESKIVDANSLWR